MPILLEIVLFIVIVICIIHLYYARGADIHTLVEIMKTDSNDCNKRFKKNEKKIAKIEKEIKNESIKID